MTLQTEHWDRKSFAAELTQIRQSMAMSASVMEEVRNDLSTLDAATGLRAGDALHLTSALNADVKQMATLDEVFAKNAKLRGIGVVFE